PDHHVQGRLHSGFYRAGSRSVITRSPAQQPACKDLERNGHNPTITFKAAYTPVSTALAHAQS
ncbi:hypothetical protein, partial [Lacticaseibacillus paracasei]|uniref:hypothetical protein n=2 Tax=Lacticaseibacillus paracasei TaxID=1597 RepID=UPI00325E1FED